MTWPLSILLVSAIAVAASFVVGRKQKKSKRIMPEGKLLKSEAVRNLRHRYDNIILIANSIGAYYAMVSHLDCLVRLAFFISPVVDLEALDGVGLSDDYLRYVRSHPIKWDVPTHILYGSDDSLIPFDAIYKFANDHEASLTVMEGGEHWFHTDAQLQFMDSWMARRKPIYLQLRIDEYDLVR